MRKLTDFQVHRLGSRQIQSDHFDAFVKQLYECGAAQEQHEVTTINMIASDNVVPVWRKIHLPYKGSMIQEGILDERPFAGAIHHNEIEKLAADIAKSVFGAEHANLQPHSCSQANQAVYHALLKPGDSVLALDFKAGGHLTHGLRQNFSGQFYNFTFFGLGGDGRIANEHILALAKDVQPKLIVCGSSSYPWMYDVDYLRCLSDDIGALLMLDLSHEGGLIASGQLSSPVSKADVVTMSLDKTLRGPHGAVILCKSILARRIDRAVHPGTQSSFPIRRLTDAALAMLDSQTDKFRDYIRRTLSMADAMANMIPITGLLVGQGTEKHYFLLNTQQSLGLSGVEAESILEQIGLLTNRQILPIDVKSNTQSSSGIRIGTAWMASRGYDVPDAVEVMNCLLDALTKNDIKDSLKARVRDLALKPRKLDCLNVQKPRWVPSDV